MDLPALSAYGPYNLAALPTEAYLALAFDLVSPRRRALVLLGHPAEGGVPPRPRSARLYDAWDSPLGATDAPTVAHRLAELGLATGDLIHLGPRFLGRPQWLRPYSVAMVLRLETEDEKRLSAELVAEGAAAEEKEAARIQAPLLGGRIPRRLRPRVMGYLNAQERRMLQWAEEGRLHVPSAEELARAEPAAPPAGARYYHPPSEGAPGFLAGGEFWKYPLRSPPLAEHLRGRVLYGPLYDPAFRAMAETWGLVAPGWGGLDEAAQRAYRAKGLWGAA